TAFPRRDQGSRKNNRHKHRRLHAGGAFLRLHGPCGWHPGTHEKSDGPKDKSDCHRRPGTTHRRSFAAHRDHRRIPHPRRPAHHLGSQSIRCAGARLAKKGLHLRTPEGLMPSAGPAMEPFNYFNYFTEIEEYFWRKRGAHLLVSPLDWAIVETWQKAGIPLGAVLKGIDRA